MRQAMLDALSYGPAIRGLSFGRLDATFSRVKRHPVSPINSMLLRTVAKLAPDGIEVSIFQGLGELLPSLARSAIPFAPYRTP
jgi:hypothetical protein